jgi:hypothetical protein
MYAISCIEAPASVVPIKCFFTHGAERPLIANAKQINHYGLEIHSFYNKAKK